MLNQVPTKLQNALLDLQQIAKGAKCAPSANQRKMISTIQEALIEHQSLILSKFAQGTPDEQKDAAQALLATIRPFAIPHPAQAVLRNILQRSKKSFIEGKIILQGQKALSDDVLFAREIDVLKMKAISLLQKELSLPFDTILKAVKSARVEMLKEKSEVSLKLYLQLNKIQYLVTGRFIRQPHLATQSTPVENSFRLESV